MNKTTSQVQEVQIFPTAQHELFQVWFIPEIYGTTQQQTEENANVNNS